MNKQLTRGRSLTILLGVALTILGCVPSNPQTVQDNPSYLSSYLDSDDYTIDSRTILSSLEKGEKDVFFPMVATPDPDSYYFTDGSVPWTQLDYLEIANALSQFVWKENLDFDNWTVHDLRIRRECRDNSVGFDSFDITYYKTIEVNLQKVYTARYIKIYPSANIVSWGGNTNFLGFDKWDSFDPRKFTITADDALQLAEENGGKEARSKVKNGCRILINTSNKKDGSWDVVYYIGASDIFEMLVDPYSGKYEVPTPSP